MSGFSTTRHRHDDLDVLALAGELDVATVPTARPEIEAALADGSGAFVVDLTGVTFMDSSALTLLMIADRLATKSGRELAVVAPDGAARRTLELTGLDQELELFASVADVAT